MDRRRVHRAPNLKHSDLNLEQVASLPLSGVPTHRALRTLPNLTKGKKALVLNAHDGAGALITQALVAQGVIVTAHVPPGSPALPIVAAAPKSVSSAGSAVSDEQEQVDSDHDTQTEETEIPSFEERAKLFGAQMVKIGEPLVVIAECKESEFDYVLDTIGGRRIWEASGWVLKSGGQVCFRLIIFMYSCSMFGFS